MKKATLLVGLLVGVTGMAQADGYLHGPPGTSYNNIGGNNCKYLIEQINQKSLSLTVANISIPNEDIPVTVNYKNIDNLYFKIVKFSPDEIFSEESYLESKQLEKLKSSAGVKEWEVKLEDSNDKLSHIKIVSTGKLPSGDYFLFCGTD